jgi:Divergent InlB B-repeat domain
MYRLIVMAVFTLALALSATASAATQTLTVKKEGTGTGTVTSSPAGIECGGTCAAPFAEGSKVVLKGAAGANTGAVKWSGCTTINLENECSVTMSAAKAVTATFNLLERPLTVLKKGLGTGTVTSSPAGIECGATCSASFIKETVVTLTGTPGAKTLPPAWSGCDSVTAENKCVVTMSIAKSVTATFDPFEFALEVKLAGLGTGTVTSSPAGIECGATCSAEFKHGSLVKLIGAPGANTDPAVQWTGCDSVDVEGKCLVAMDAVRTVTATFNLIKYQLTTKKLGSGTGTVTSAPSGISCGATCHASYSHGTSVILSGAPGLHSEAVKWAGCDKLVEENKCQVSTEAAREVSAAFNLEPQYVEYTVTVNPKGTGKGSVESIPSGISCPGDCSETYVFKTPVKLVATPAPGSEFAHWSGGSCSGTGPCERKINSNRTVNAVFKAVGNRTLTVSKAGSGSGVVTSKPAAIECGQTCSSELDASIKVALHALPAAGSTFTGWSGEGCSGTGSCKVLMNEARNVTATFTRDSRPQPQGVLSVRNPIRVKGRRALLRLSCQGGPCRGTLRLLAMVKSSSGRARNVSIGSTSINLQAGVSSSQGMRLSRTGTSLLRKAGRLRVRVAGGGMRPHNVKLSLQRR